MDRCREITVHKEMREMVKKEDMAQYNPSVPHIVYAADDKFAEILGVSLVSLYENNRDMDDIVVYVLDSNITNENKEKIVSVSRKYQRSEVNFIPAENISKKLAIDVAVDRGSLSQYARLFIASDLPKELERVLYLDCDTVINKSIKELWNLNLHGKTIGALMDAFSKYYRVNIDLEPNDIMFNSGVMLIDLNKWKKQDVEEKLLKFIVKKQGRIQQGDQGALNAILSYDTYCFDPRFNSLTIFYDFTYREMLAYRKPPKFYSESEVKKAINNPVIIHFTTSIFSKRPWMIGCKHKYFSKWMEYKKKSPWNDLDLWVDDRPQWKQMIAKILRRIPKRISIKIAGVMQIYVRPFVNRLKNIKHIKCKSLYNKFYSQQCS